MNATFRRRVLYRAATSDRLERLALGASPVRRAACRRARRYVGGVTLSDAMGTVRRLGAEGMACSLDLFGEGTATTSEVDRVVDGYCQAARALASVDVEADLEVVPSHLGLDLGAAVWLAAAGRLAQVLPSGGRLQVSAEEHWHADQVTDVVIRLAETGVPVVATVQANLRRSDADVERLAAAGVGIRLVKGAYPASPSVARPWGEETDVAYLRVALRLAESGASLSLGTHDPVLREAVLASHPKVGVEMLLGVRPADARDLVARGHDVRIYVPYGDRWFRYWLRRIAEAQGA